LIKKDVVSKRIIFYNNKKFELNQNYKYIKNKNWNNLDYFLSQGDTIDILYNDYLRVYINMTNPETQKNLSEKKELISNFITKEVYSKFEQILKCKSCNTLITFNLKNEDFENLKKFYEILYPENSSKQNLSMLSMLYDNLYKNLQIKIDLENINKLKNHNTDIAIVNFIAGLKKEMSKIESSETSMLNKFNNRLKIIQYVKNSRNILFNFSDDLFDEVKKGMFNDIKNLKKNYV
jgi:hypothetical protein